MNKKTMILIMVVSITVVLFMSLWSMSVEENSDKILLFTPLPLLCVIASGKGKGTLYAHEEIVLDENGVVVDLILSSVNDRFVENIM